MSIASGGITRKSKTSESIEDHEFFKKSKNKKNDVRNLEFGKKIDSENNQKIK